MKRTSAALLLSLLALSARVGAADAEIAAVTRHSFAGGDGFQPRGPLVDGGDGYLYGTASQGGSNAVVTNPAGTVYRIALDGSLETLYTFEFQVTGDFPVAGVLRLGGGTLFGTTRGSGSYVGDVFSLATTGDFTNLHTFSGYFGGNDGGHPESPLAEGGDGNLYGMTLDGGTANVGTLYRIDSSGGYTLLHSFSGAGGAADGATPSGALVLADDGNLYGTTTANGPTQPSPAVGTVFRFTPGVSGVTTIHAFRGLDGTGPGTLVKGLDGKLYGTTTGGGANGRGTVFRIDTNGDFAVVHPFSADFSDGSGPAGLTVGSDGNLYGTMSSGGKGLGTVFRVTPNGAFSTLFAFDPLGSIQGGGSSPQGPLVQVGSTLYGTTSLGGTTGHGTFFVLEGLSVPVPEADATSCGVTAALALVLARRRRCRHRPSAQRHLR